MMTFPVAAASRHVRLLQRSAGVSSSRILSSTPNSGNQAVLMSFSTKAKEQKSSQQQLSYFERKKIAKEQRTLEYQQKVERSKLKAKRRSNAPKNVLKNEFREWFDRKVAFEEKVDRLARREGLDWKLQVAVILERIPVVLPDKEQWEIDFEVIQAEQAFYGKDYPPEFSNTTSTEERGPAVFTDEELIAQLPEGFVPAPRETAADEAGDVRTMDRKLKDRIFLTVQDTDSSNWSFPTVSLKKDETLLDAAKRAIVEKVSGENIDLYCPSNAPVAVDVYVYPEKERQDGCFGVKTFFMKIQHDEGTVAKKNLAVNDFAWLNRSEFVDKVREEQGESQSKFFRYLL